MALGSVTMMLCAFSTPNDADISGLLSLDISCDDLYAESVDNDQAKEAERTTLGSEGEKASSFKVNLTHDLLPVFSCILFVQHLNYCLSCGVVDDSRR
ncbi:hypothetical protein IW261DRAFT_344379 [Armillaria novae-zelandiae]|uniref:Uncharacterized protein n=1 Tax=Armillaria novae-zelandiae TaxID=153914 RepID=A0AA39N748_9AGAR|nr:hypothetical protein IW261DRAFT_344379 [Armillaria novae-zelandiae]